MKIQCKCGAVIYDQTDFISNKAHLIADQDWFDFLDSATKGEDGFDTSLSRKCYQCTNCGRLYVDNFNRELQSFVPEGPSTETLRSCKGNAWPAPLIAHWIDNPSADQARATIWCESAELIEVVYANWEEFERAYFKLFNDLRTVGLLRSAYLTKNHQKAHSWSSDSGT